MKKVIISVFGSLAVTFFCRAAEPYQLLKEIPVGGDGGWDYLAVDSAAHRLYVSHAMKVIVIDLAKDEVAGEITNTPGVHGIAIAPDLNRGFTSNGHGTNVSIFDLKTLQVLSRAPTGNNPDAILYNPNQKSVWAFNGGSHSVTVIDTQPICWGTVPLPGKPEFAVMDSKAGRIYNNLEDKNEVAVLDARNPHVVATWPIAPGDEASGLAFDVKNHRLLLGCGNKMMVMMDSESGKVVANVPIGDGVDANVFDPGTQLAFASCGDGTVTIAHEDAPDKLTVVQTLKTEKGARTMAIDPATHKIYLASAQFAEPAAGQRRGKMVPGSFKILIYGMKKE